MFSSQTCRPICWIVLLPACMIVSLSVASWSAAAEQARRDLRDVIGVTHVNGKYHLTEQDFLNEGADQVLGLGSRVIKLYLTVPPTSANPHSKVYPFNSNWPRARSLVELAATPYFRKVFAKPFSTYILTAYSAGRPDHYWLRGVTEKQAADETRQFHEFARYLLTTYRDTGKTFVLQNWEGDWAIRGRFDPKVDPTPMAIEGMIGWLNARQRGVDQAREEIGQHGVWVYHAAEVNLVKGCLLDGRPGMTDKVLPHTHVDLVSYSAWDIQNDRDLFRRALDFIAKHAPDRSPFGERNVYVGEFGAPENERTPAEMRKTVEDVIDVGLDWGCPYLVYWQVYCNEFSRSVPHPAAPVGSNDAVRGFWLIRPDGSKSPSWHLLHARLRGS